ncbi:hypothetical protein [Azospirillum sp. A39]|uniref:hypothetical protein n=1 Tax=Azospirillum sp. A39 TaxID=3462279 RepID=UPI004045D714
MRRSTVRHVPATAAPRRARAAAWPAVLAVLVQILLPVQALLAAVDLNAGWDSVCLADAARRAGADPTGPASSSRGVPAAGICPVCTAVAAAVGAPPPLPAVVPVPLARVTLSGDAPSCAAAPTVAACRPPPCRAPPATA